VSEDNEVWHKDDGSLSLVLCEDVHEGEFDQPKFDFHCCACVDASYEVIVCAIGLIVHRF